MKKYVVILVVVLGAFAVKAQDQKILVDVTSTDPKVYESVMLMVKIMAENHPNTTFEVMVYGPALPMFLKDSSKVADEVLKYVDNENVIFTACEISMGLFNVEKEQLLEGVGTVANAVVEIVDRQIAGDWGYIKSGI